MPGAVLVLAVVAAGGLLALQARLNGDLGVHVHSAITAAAVSFAGGFLILLLLTLSRTRRAGLTRLLGATTRWWWWLGGLAGAAVVSGTADGVPRLGVALVSVCVVAGTAVGALAVDHAGLGPGGHQRVTWLRVTGAMIAVGAVTLGAVGDPHSAVRPALFLILFFAGAASAVQQAANGRIRLAADDSIVAALVSFFGGTVVLALLAALTNGLTHRSWPHSWWLYLGGLFGAIYIALAAAVVHRFGVLRLSLATVAGQLAGAVILDVAWPAPGTSLRTATVVGTGLTFVSVAFAGAGRASVGSRDPRDDARRAG